MQILLLEENKLKIVLTQAELPEKGAGRQEKERWLRAILDKAKNETGFAPRNARLLAELHIGSGGGILWVTAFWATVEPVVFCFPTAGTLGEAAARIFGKCRRRIGSSALYCRAGGYHLVLHPLDYYDNLSLSLLGEYAQLTGRGALAAAYTAEHGSPLIAENAVDILAEHFAG